MSKTLDLKKTLNLPRTDFSMKANLPQLEPRIFSFWEKMGLNGKIISSRKGCQTFVLHDGPPYANGHIHLGHALNKILKDFIVKSKTMEGYLSHYVPGWDCHGLPIEIKVTGENKKGGDPLRIRRECRKYAEKFLKIQREEFKQLGIFGEWDHPYLTMSNRYEAEITRIFGVFVEKGSVYRGFKPVHWCISCETALAEAEVKYEDHTSLSVYVKFPVLSGISALSPELENRKISILIWTTTPWTLPANLAICFHPKLDYSFVEVGTETYIIATDLLPQVAQDCNLQDYRISKTIRGEALQYLTVKHPWINRESKVILANHVTLEQGTGAVHTAPGHGHDDYQVGLTAGLAAYCPVDSSGRFTPDIEHFSGLQVFETNSKIAQFMSERGVLAGKHTITHSYPHCWRCHNPVIFRATKQWFISMDHADLRSHALREIQQVRWTPSWGQQRISNMIAQRPDWCISRQRCWGVPIVALHCKKCEQPILRPEIARYVADIFEQESADAWYSRTVPELIPEGTSCDCGSTEFEKEYDILDVWFDSGSSHSVVLGNTETLPWPADVYLEGPDQYRGWFHSSLLIGVALKDAAPYRQVICNGWTLDTDGHAMSKSRGNVISPLDIIRDNGAEILRLWVASIDYTEDVRLGEETLSRLREAYRKIRNTNRFLLANLYDFDRKQQPTDTDLTELDRWALARLANVAQSVKEAYNRFEFHAAYHLLYNFCVVDLSSFYLDVLKDRLYILAPDSTPRQTSQFVMFRIADTLVRLLAPILPFTCEEIWTHLYPDTRPTESVHIAEFSKKIKQHRNERLLQKWKILLEIRSKVSKSLEENRQKKKIRNSLEASIHLRCGPQVFQYLQYFSEDLAELFIVSRVELIAGQELGDDDIEISVSPAPGGKCGRCWKYLPSVGEKQNLPEICSRCYQILVEMGEIDD